VEGRPLTCHIEQPTKETFLPDFPNLFHYRFGVILPLSFSQKSHPAWLTQVADHLVPNQVLGFFEFFRERERGKFFIFKGLQKPLSAQMQGI